MKRIILLATFSSLFLVPKAQVWDDFNDGDLIENPAWFGDRDSFMVNSSSQLQLNALGAGRAHLSTGLSLSNITEDMEWRFWIRESFSPSNNNYARFYLMSDRSNLLDTGLQGYYLKFGESLSNDAVRLYCQQGNTHTLLCSATEGAIAGNFDIHVKVIRSATGKWTLYCSDKGSAILKEETHCTDTTLTTSDYIGLACYYTASNRNKFYFDDIYCGGLYIDTIPPNITNIAVNQQTKNEITITFNEDIDSVSSFYRMNYWVDNNIGYPDSVYFSQNDLSRIHLIYINHLPVNIPLTLSVGKITDLAGNRMTDTTFHFSLYQSQLFDIVISEIMAKPSPVINLPEAEYIELKNRKSYPINLDGWQLQLGNSSRILPNITIAANGYLLITSASNTNSFTGYGDVATISSMQITDAGQTIRLTNNNENLIHFVSFSDSWYENTIKKNGGWSLEMIDTENPCEEKNNWSSSQNNNGGTPCKENSISRHNPDITTPLLEKVAYEGDNIISIYFSETMLPDRFSNKNTYQFSHSIQIDSIISIANNLRSITIKLSDSLLSGVIYTLTIIDTLFDCVENSIPIQSFISFGYATYPNINDVIINEILFNPKEGGVDFVEIYNRSDKIIDLRSLRLSGYKSDGSIDTGKMVSPSGRQLFPQQYMVLTTNPDIIQSHYYCPYPENFILMNSLPGYSNTSGTVILLHDAEIIDLFTYNEKMHYPLLKSYKGVSLERINYERKAQDEFNWHSASSTVEYATPGYRNSSFSSNIEQTSYFEVYPEIFSPDNDGYNDNLNISYSFPQPGYRASVYIYNVNGKKVRTLVNNQLLETEGYFVWDGVIEGNIKATIGTYIILIEYWNPEGKTGRIKKTCTLAIKFK